MIRVMRHRYPGSRVALLATLARLHQRQEGGPGVRNPTGESEIFAVNPDGGGLKQLTFNTADDYAPDHSPDGEEITFISDRDGASDDVDDIFEMDADGSDQRNLTKSPRADDSFSVWSPDGEEVAFTSDRDGNFEVYKMKDDGRGQRNLTRNPADDSGPDWSPDGKKIAFQSDRDGSFDIFRMSASGANPIRLTEDDAYDSEPDWQPNPRR